MRFLNTALDKVLALTPQVVGRTAGDTAENLASHYRVVSANGVHTSADSSAFLYLALAVMGAEIHRTDDESHPRLAKITLA